MEVRVTVNDPVANFNLSRTLIRARFRRWEAAVEGRPPKRSSDRRGAASAQGTRTGHLSTGRAYATRVDNLTAGRRRPSCADCRYPVPIYRFTDQSTAILPRHEVIDGEQGDSGDSQFASHHLGSVRIAASLHFIHFIVARYAGVETRLPLWEWVAPRTRTTLRRNTKARRLARGRSRQCDGS
jgi:hypothetical protein